MRPENHVDRGWQLLDDGDVAGAQRAAREALRADPGSLDAMLLQAACERAEGRTAEAEQRLRRVAAADPRWAAPVLWLAEILAEDPERQTEALRHARRAVELAADDRDERLRGTVLVARLALDGGDEEAARDALREVPPADAVEDPEVALDVADLFLALDEAALARPRYLAVTRAHPEMADAWHGLGMAAEALGDDRGAVAAWLESVRRDVATPLDEEVARLSEDQFVEVAEEALEELPERAQALLRDVPILVTDLPSEQDVRQGLDPRLLGVFSGLPYADQSALGGGPPQLTQIVLFRRNLERVTGDVDELRKEIRITLIHETGHFFGLSEDELHAMGLG